MIIYPIDYTKWQVYMRDIGASGVPESVMNIYEERSELFGERYEDFEPLEILSLVQRTGEWLSLLLMDDAATEKVMHVLFEQICSPATEYEELPWRELFEEHSHSYQFDIRSAQFMVALNAFAFYGLKPDTNFFSFGGHAVSVEEAVGRYVSTARNFLDAIPAGWISLEEITRTVLAAEARWALDTSGDVTPEQLAALARISLKSMRNLMSGQADLKPTEAGARIPGMVASRWLEGRTNFLGSIWQMADPNVDGRLVTEPETQPLGEVLFVPVAKDGSWFDPVACRTANGYTIGPKGGEETIPDYREALSRLVQMPKPCWRRPNAAGNRGIVIGVNWIRKESRELQLETDGA